MLASRRLIGSLALSLAALALVVPAASAHPLGNFTINHYSGIRVEPDAIVIDHVTDFAEIPTFTDRRAMDLDANGDVSTGEAAQYERAACVGLADELRLSAAGRALVLQPTHTGLSFPMGQGSPTMRLVCVYRAALLDAMANGATIEFEDGSYAERRGWREIVVEGDRTAIVSTDAPAVGTSARLTSYPRDLLAVPLGQSSATFTIRPGGPALPEVQIPDASPIDWAPAPDSPPSEDGWTEAEQATAVEPTGVTELGRDVTALFQAPDLTPPIVALGLLVAAALGALHALSPGHGKTVMAAYLVGSRGNMRHAVGLGLTVTVSHTLGVLCLGALSLSAAALIPPERLYPILSVVSGAIVVVIGGYLLVSRLQTWHRTRAHDHAHEQGNEHEHHHPSSGWHEHDGVGHNHVPEDGTGWRGLFALGLSGGMVPSVSALLVLIGSISIGRPAYGIVLTVAFGIGMAVVLVGVGMAFVYARRFLERVPVATPLRLGQRLPLVTAAVVLIAGLVITGQGLSALG